MSQLAQRLFMASGGKKSSTYVDDVFSTYLYKGTDLPQTIENGLKLGNSNAGGSVKFQEGSLDKLSFASTSDFTFGTGDFTIECFVNYNAISNDGIFSLSSTAGGITTGSALSLNVLSSDGGKYAVYFKNTQNGTSAPGTCNNAVVTTGQWYHLAMVRQSGQSRFFVNGVAQTFGSDCTNDITITDTTNYTWTDLGLGGYYDNTFLLNGSISNFRITKGQALYWSNFTAPTQALTTTSQGATASNVKLLCCNKDTVTGKTVGPTITASGNPIASGFGPFTGSGGEGGLVWNKERTGSNWHQLFDTERGVGKRLASNVNNAEMTDTTTLSAFNNNGFSIGTNDIINDTGDDYASWSFRKAKGFFDIVTWTGNNTGGRQIAHNLGSVPGCIMIKNTNNTQNWQVYNRGIGAGSAVFLDLNNAKQTGAQFFNNTEPTATHFTLGTDCMNNCPGYDYVAYIFAGGASTAATARSVDFDGSGDYLTQTCDAVLRNWWDQAFTVEYWVNADGFVSSGNGGPGVLGVCAPTSNGETWSFGPKSNGTVEFYYWNGSIQQVTTTKALNLGQWYHLAMVYDGSSSIKIYIDGTLEKSVTKAGSPTGASTVFSIGKIANGSEFNGRVSNVRITHQALYTSSFKPSTEPFTTTSQGATGSNVKLLCCNNSSVTGSTVTPASITANGNPTASTNIPFDDPEGFKFGEEGDQNIIKTGSYTGNTTTKPEINLGFEPQWLLVKNTNLSTEQWFIFDSMRGIISDGTDYVLQPSLDAQETGWDLIDLTPTGFKIKINDDKVNNNGGNYIYMAIRRPDPLVAKPVEDATKVFAMDNGSQNDLPGYVSGFPLDFYIYRDPTTSSGWMSNWNTYARLIARKYLRTNTSESQVTDNAATFNFMNGAQDYNNFGTNFLAWMWKRYSGFDVVTYTGNGGTAGGRVIKHSLNQKPQMIWIKHRTSANYNWTVYHEGLNGGTNPEQKYLILNTNDSQSTASNVWNDMPPTSNDFIIGSNDMVNNGSQPFLAMLFATVDGISKVGSYTGTDGSTITITTGFPPRFIVVKKTDGAGSWHVFDTVRGMGSGNDPVLLLNNTNAQVAVDYITPTSDGWQTVGANLSQGNFIYYAHA